MLLRVEHALLLLPLLGAARLDQLVLRIPMQGRTLGRVHSLQDRSPLPWTRCTWFLRDHLSLYLFLRRQLVSILSNQVLVDFMIRALNQVLGHSDVRPHCLSMIRDLPVEAASNLLVISNRLRRVLRRHPVTDDDSGVLLVRVLIRHRALSVLKVADDAHVLV